MPQRPPTYRPPRTGPAPCDAARGTATERGYDAHWQRARLSFLADHPLCARCRAKGRIAEATVVDHIVAHKGDRMLFWDMANWQPLCTTCHDRKSATEDGGFGRPVKTSEG